MNTRNPHLRILFAGACVAWLLVLGACSSVALPPDTSAASGMAHRHRELIVVGVDEKINVVNGDFVAGAPGGDAVVILDIGADPLAPTLVASLPLMNSIYGPPTNLAITPDQRLALVANSMQWQSDKGVWKGVPDDRLYVIDLAATPPQLIDTLKVGRQPSGMSINRNGNLALIANRADQSVSVLRIDGSQVTLIGNVPIGEQVAHVAFAPDGKRAYAAKFASHKVAVLEVDGEKVSYERQDITVGLWPYNLDITPDGRLALTADNGAGGRSDGSVDTVSVIDLGAQPARTIDKVVVNEAPEGFVISPTGKLAAAILINGGDARVDSWFRHEQGKVAILKIDGTHVSRAQEIEVGVLPEGAVFSDDGQYLYVGNYTDRTISILKVDGDHVTDTGHLYVLPGHPASMRARTR